jgi:hypothetical protein
MLKALGGSPTVPVDATALYRAGKSADFDVMRLLGADFIRILPPNARVEC